MMVILQKKFHRLFHVAAVCAVVITSFVFLIFGDNLFLPLVRPV